MFLSLIFHWYWADWTMISNPCDTGEYDYLVFDSPIAGFMLNRNQFVSGIFIFGERCFATSIEYIISSVAFQESRVAVFDLDGFLANVYQRKSEPALKVDLICDLSTFSDQNRFLYETFIRRHNETISTAFLAIRISGHARIAKCRFAEIRLLPPSLRKKQNEMGILGCGFPGGHSVSFFLDVEKILANLLQTNLK